MINKVFLGRNLSRVWTYDRHTWDPPWYNKIGIPYLGMDEWGRYTIVIGLWFIGYIVIAYWTCQCITCQVERDELIKEMTQHSP